MSAATTVSQAMPPIATAAFDSAVIPLSDRSSWCQSQLQTCEDICYNGILENFCDPSSTTIAFACSCNNGTTPDVTAFEGTIPTFICQTTYTQCVEDAVDDQAAQTNCAGNLALCGTRNATAEALVHQQEGDVTATSGSASEQTSLTSRAGGGSGTASTDSPPTNTSPGTTNSLVPGDPPPSLSSDGLSTGAIAGIAVAAALLAIALVVFAFWRFRRNRKAKARPNMPELAEEKSRRVEVATNANRHELGGERKRFELGVGDGVVRVHELEGSEGEEAVVRAGGGGVRR